MRIEVHKFGGTSVLGAERMRAAAALIAQASSRARIVVVSSAMSGVTNLLVEAAAAAAAADTPRALDAVEKIRAMHARALGETEGPDGPVRRSVMTLIDDLADVIRGAGLVGEVTPRTRDRIVAVGEKLSVRILALILRTMGHSSEAHDADTFINTDANYSDASPLPFVTDREIDAYLKPRLDSGEIPVVTGFMGRAPDGSTTTFSRGGSDYTATLIAGALGADEVTIWTDVDGVFTTDPRMVPDAALIPQLNYREAGELSYYGAKVLHQRTMIPVAARRIPVWVRNTLNPSAPGTVVDGRTAPGPHPVKGVTAIRDQALLSLEGKGMSGVPGVSARLFGALASRGISVTMISQSSSESSVCLAVPGADAASAEAAIKREFRADTARGDIEDLGVRQGVALVAAVGLGMAHTPGVSGHVFGALGDAAVNVLAIAQGSSELNITLAVDQKDAPRAVSAIHARFALDEPGGPPIAEPRTDLLILGCGQVGRALIELLIARDHAHRPRLRVCAVADSSGFVFRPGGISRSELRAMCAAKEAGAPLSRIDGGKPGSFDELVQAAANALLSRPVLVDVSDSPASHPPMVAALSRGWDVVTANKRPLGESWETFEALRRAAGMSGRTLRAEATVGAGLPVIDTLAMLRATADDVARIEGCFSGTLGLVMSALDSGTAFSDAVAEAIRLGYTEPDPVSDLSGADVARKGVILGRMSGLLGASGRVALEPLAPSSLGGRTAPELLVELRKLDAGLSDRARSAASRGCVLRFVATVTQGHAEIGVREVPRESPLGSLRGTDNMIVFHTRRYSSRPLVVAGPGAGAELTASGVLADILRLRGGVA